jgi:hypothetical protein
MKNFLSIVIIFAAFLMSSDSTYAQADTDKSVIAEAERISGDTFAKKKKTPKGALVYGVNKPSKAVLKAIDKGLKTLFEVAKKNGYSAKLNYSDYVVFIAKPDRDKDAGGNYSPDIAVNAGQYKDSVYDKGGYIFAAGMVVAYQPCAFLIGEHTKDFNRISDVVRYEGEHLVLYHNDRKRFNETADHSKGGGHPILQ